MARDASKVMLPAESEDDSPEVVAPVRKKQNKRVKRKKMTRTRAVQLCIDSLGPDASTAEVRDEVKRLYGFDLKTTNISQYKSVYLKKVREGAPRASDLPDPVTVNRGGRPPKVKPVLESALARGGDPTLEEIRAVKAVYDRIGGERFGEMMTLIAGL